MTERIYRVLLALCPRAFRERFGDEMLATARDVDRNNRGLRGNIATIAAAVDAIRTAARLHADDRAARRRLENSNPTIETGTTMTALLRDLRYAARGLVRERGFTAFVVVTLALGIGANAAMFGIADRLLFRGPEHVQDADRVARLYLSMEPQGMQRFTGPWFGHVSYELLQEDARSFTQLATYTVHNSTVGRGDNARPIRLGYSSASLFPMLGVTPHTGRFFDEREDAAGAGQRVAVVGHGLWQERFGGAPDIIGRSIEIGDESFTVIGVAPRGFTGPELGVVDVWAPMNLLGVRVSESWQTAWNAQWLKIVGRLADGVTLEQASREATLLHRRAYTGDEEAMRAGTMLAAPLSANESGVTSTESRVLQWLTGVSLLVLVIACANVANLLLARGMRRGREIAIRAALGAGRRRLVNLLLIESLLLSLSGAALGLLVAWMLGDAARAALFDAVEWSSSPVNPRVIAAATALAVVTGILMGLVPAVRASRTDLTGALRAGARDGHGRRSRLRSTLTVAQAALSVLLLVGAGLFVRSLWNVRNLDIGLDPEQTLMVSVNRPSLARVPAGPERTAESARRRGFAAMAAERLKSVPGVENAAVAIGLPFGSRFSVRTRVPGMDSMPRLSTGGPSVSAVTAGYFSTVGTDIIRGRGFTAADRAGSEPVAIVSEQMARTVWPGADPIGTCLLVGAPREGPDGTATIPCHRIVGIAEDTRRNSLREEPTMHYYIPYGQERGFGGAELLVRARTDAHAVIGDVRRVLLDLDPAISYVRAETLQERIDPQMRPWKLGAIVFLLSGVLALVVAAIGVYSVMSYLIADRRHEIGVRLALGALAGDIVRLVLRGSFAIAVAGVLLGEALALLLGRFAEPLLFETTARDPLVFAAVGVTLVVVALVATIIPALEARRVNPIEALRVD